jgi:hypothetical protein
MNDPFELSGKPVPPVTVWVIARGVFWGLMLWAFVMFLIGLGLGIAGIGV